MKIYLIDNMKRQKIINRKLAVKLLFEAGYASNWLEVKIDQAIPVENGLSVLFLQGGTK